jgi:tetratricopeptide (TPR) repeat protein
MPSREVIAGILQSGRQAFSQGRLERAINLFRRVQEGYPDAPERSEATLLLAQTLEANGEAAPALAEYRRLTTEFPNAPQAVVARTKIPDLERQLSAARPPIVSQVIGVYAGKHGIETLDERELGRLRQSGTNTLVVEATRSRASQRPTVGGGSGAGVYFKTDWANVIQDRLAVLVNGAHRQGIQVWAAVSVRRMDWIDPSLGWSDRRYNPQASELVASETLDLMHPAVPEYLIGLFTDLAAAGVDGLLLLADPPSGPGDGFSSHALSRFERDIGQAIDPSRLQLAQGRDRTLLYAPEFWRWVGWKQREQLKVVDGVMRAVRKAHPHLKVAIEVHSEAVTSPRGALAWYAEDILDLKRYRFDYIALQFSPSLGPWVNQLADTVTKERLLFLVESSESNRSKPSVIPTGTGLIYKEKPESADLTNRGR